MAEVLAECIGGGSEDLSMNADLLDGEREKVARDSRVQVYGRCHDAAITQLDAAGIDRMDRRDWCSVACSDVDSGKGATERSRRRRVRAGVSCVRLQAEHAASVGAGGGLVVVPWGGGGHARRRR